MQAFYLSLIFGYMYILILRGFFAQITIDAPTRVDIGSSYIVTCTSTRYIVYFYQNDSFVAETRIDSVERECIVDRIVTRSYSCTFQELDENRTFKLNFTVNEIPGTVSWYCTNDNGKERSETIYVIVDDHPVTPKQKPPNIPVQKPSIPDEKPIEQDMKPIALIGSVGGVSFIVLVIVIFLLIYKCNKQKQSARAPETPTMIIDRNSLYISYSDERLHKTIQESVNNAAATDGNGPSKEQENPDFDPNKTYTEVNKRVVSGFDPNKIYTEVNKRVVSEFDPNKIYTEVNKRVVSGFDPNKIYTEVNKPLV